MKVLTFVFICLFAFVTANGQQAAQAKSQQDKEQSNIEKFSSRSGILFEKTNIPVGSFRGVKVQVMTIRDLINQSKTAGLRFENIVTTRIGSDTKIASLDDDELDALVKSLEIIKTDVLPSARQNYTEIIYRSRSGFEAGCFYSGGKWSAFVKLERYDKDSYVFIEPPDLDSLLALLKQAKPILQQSK
ncbi:hypothetical protein [Bacteriophage sp.]|nr:hypothetical protein [Bacteriophage sp.]